MSLWKVPDMETKELMVQLLQEYPIGNNEPLPGSEAGCTGRDENSQTATRLSESPILGSFRVYGRALNLFFISLPDVESFKRKGRAVIALPRISNKQFFWIGRPERPYLFTPPEFL